MTTPPSYSRSKCETCHDPKLAKDANQYLTDPSRRACGSCHDDVNFATGENHAGLPQVSDNQCRNCHQPMGELEFDLSIKGAHTVARFSESLAGVNFTLREVTNTKPGEKPKVTFSITTDQGAGIKSSDMTRLALVLAGDTGDYTRNFSEDARTATLSGNGNYTYTFNQAIPADAKGTWAVGIEGYRNATLLPDTVRSQTVRDAGQNKVIYLAVTDAKPNARRQVVSQEKCNACHISIDVHGSNRNQVEQCVLCHNPTATDAARRPADKAPPEGINFKEMIHKIHRGEELEDDYTLYGFGGTPHNYNEVRFPNDLSDCEICHLPGTYQLPVPKTAIASVQPRGFFNPQSPATGACLSCHTTMAAAAHADLNISPRLGEACVVCHGPTSEFSVDRVHAR